MLRLSLINRQRSEASNPVAGTSKKATQAMSRRKCSAILFGFITLLAFLVWADRSFYKGLSNEKPTAEKQIKSYDFEKYHGKVFTVVNVVDGDTIDIDIADGKYERTRIRLWGVDTPETKSKKYGVMYYGPEASEFTGDLVLDKKVTVYLEERRTRGKYGRLLAYVGLAGGGYLNEILISEGYGYADTRFRHSFYNKYKQLGSTARSNRKGLWEKVLPDQMPEWKRKRE